MLITFIRAIVRFGDVLSFLLLIRALFSWIRIPLSGNKVFSSINEIIYKLTEPLVAPVRKFMYEHVNTGMFDFSIFVTMILIEVITRVLVRILVLFI